MNPLVNLRRIVRSLPLLVGVFVLAAPALHAQTLAPVNEALPPQPASPWGAPPPLQSAPPVQPPTVQAQVTVAPAPPTGAQVPPPPVPFVPAPGTYAPPPYGYGYAQSQSPYSMSPVQMPVRDPRVPGLHTVPVLIDSTGDPQAVAIEGYVDPNPSAGFHDGNLCVTPCTLHLDPGSTVVTTSAPGLRPTDTQLLVTGQPLHISVRAVARSGRTAGVVSLIVGGSLIVAGAYGMFLGALINSAETSSCYGGCGGSTTGTNDGTPWIVAGAVVGVGGAALMIVGGVLMAGSGTHADVEPMQAAPVLQPRFGMIPTHGGALGTAGFAF